MNLFDAHCHLQDKQFAGRLPVVIGKARAAGVERMSCCGCEEQDWEAVRKIALEYKMVLPSFGLYPLNVAGRSEQWLEQLKSFLLSIPSGVGEIGLDNSFEAPRGKPRDNLLRRSSPGYAGRVFAKPFDLSAEAIRAKGEATNAIMSCHSSFGATEDPPCAKPQGFAYSAEVKPLATKAGLAKECEPGNNLEQEKVFVAQLRLARELQRPVTIHCRKAWGRLLEIIKQEGGVKFGGILHTYSGSAELVCLFEELGLSISFSGAITRDGNKRGCKSLPTVSKERLLLETDSPDIMPVGGAGTCNEPANLPLIARAAALLLGESVETVAELTFNNANRLFCFKEL